MGHWRNLATKRNFLTYDDQWDQWLLGIYMKNAGHTYARGTVQRKLAATLMNKHSSWTFVKSNHFASCMLDNTVAMDYDDTDTVRRF